MSPEEENLYLISNYLASVRKEIIERKRKDWYVRALILSVIQNGGTWKQVGEALGVSSQAAWKKYHPEAPQKIVPGQGPYHVEHK